MDISLAYYTYERRVAKLEYLHMIYYFESYLSQLLILLK